MHQLTDKEIEAGVKAIVEPLREYDWRDVEVEIVKNLPTSVLIEIRGEYDSPCKCDDALLTALREFFSAASAEWYDSIEEGGCDTCDYGSSYGFAVRVWD